jgi:hypothetical protein
MPVPSSSGLWRSLSAGLDADSFLHEGDTGRDDASSLVKTAMPLMAPRQGMQIVMTIRTGKARLIGFRYLRCVSHRHT